MIVVWIPAARCLGAEGDEWASCKSDMFSVISQTSGRDPDYAELPILFGWVVPEIVRITLHLLQSEVLLLLFLRAGFLVKSCGRY